MRKGKRRLLWLVPLLLIAVLAAGFGLFVSDYYRASDEALACLSAGGDGVSVGDDGSVVSLDGPGEEIGLIFYPGAKVAHTAYLPLLRTLARDGVDCYLVRMPFNLALFGVNRASDLIAREEKQRWYLAGHSMGGAMAAGWAADHPGALEGLILLAAYPVRQLPEDLRVLVLYGSEDGVLNRVNLESAARYLPGDARIVELPGGNHAQFGDYGPQKGDGTATLSRQEQQRRTAELIEKLIAGDD